MTINCNELFQELGGETNVSFPSMPSEVFYTEQGVPYLKKSGVACIGRTMSALDTIQDFLHGFDDSLRFPEYLHDTGIPGGREFLDGAELCKVAGQLCYMSFGPGRTKNDQAGKYFNNVKQQKHGSILEHANFTFLLYGVSRSLTHELVRHRHLSFCLTGDTVVYSGRFDKDGKAKNKVKRRLDYLYALSQTPHGKGGMKNLRIRCLNEQTNSFTNGGVKSIVQSGVKPVFTITLADGKTITSTKEHRFLTKKGWMPLEMIVDNLSVSKSGMAVYGNLDTEIMTNGQPVYKNADWLREHYVTKGLSQEEIASIAGVSKHTIRSWVKKHKLQKPMGSWTTGVSPWNTGKRYQTGKKKSEEDCIQISERMKGEGNHRWKGGTTPKGIVLRRGVEDLRPEIYVRDNYTCHLCGTRGGKLTIHHILPVWARLDLVCEPDNLTTLCRSCHLKVNGHEEEYVEIFGRKQEELNGVTRPPKEGPWLVPKPVKITSIVYAGEQMTYDIEMEGPNHNFIANGIITHNSQVSQRYVSGKTLRFVERPEYQDDTTLHDHFLQRIERAAKEYAVLAGILLGLQKSSNDLLVAEAKTDLRKKVRQAARSCLPNETEAPIVVTGNARAWRHFLEMRASEHAEIEIRELATRVFLCLHQIDPILFGDYRLEKLQDGTHVVNTEYRKV